MTEDRSSVSGARSYREIGEFWGAHGLGEYWEQTEPAEFDVNIRSSVTYYPVETNLAARLRSIAEQHGILAETLLNCGCRRRPRKKPPRSARPKRRMPEGSEAERR